MTDNRLVSQLAYSDEMKQTLEKMSRVSSQLKGLDNIDFSIFSGKLQELLKCNKNLHNVLIPFPISEAVKNYIEEEKESKDLSQDDFEKRYSAEMDMCKVLGKNGWVVSGHSNPRIIKEWYDDIQSGNVKEIEDFFTENENHVLKTIIDDLKKRYVEPANERYFLNGIEAFEREDYMTSAMYLVALLDVRVNKFMTFPKGANTYSKKYSKKGFANKEDSKYKDADDLLTKRFYFLDTFPSLIEYLRRLFVDGEYSFEKGVEPPYINRNWLLHGRSYRDVERYECIQVLNALDAIESVLV